MVKTGKYGTFSEPGYVSVGDPFVKPKGTGGRDQGLNFKATLTKTGKGTDGTFDKFKPLYEKEPYEAPTKNRVEQITARRAKQVTELPFKPCTPMKHSSGLGDFYGTLSGKVKYIEQGALTQQKKKGDFEPMPPNIKTNPIKKGGYGYAKTTLSEKHPESKTKGVAGEYEYKSEPFEGGGTMQRLAKLTVEKSKQVSDLPFKPANPGKKGTYGMTKTTMGGKAQGIMGEYKYVEQGPTAPPRHGISEVAPFKPSNPPKKGYNCTMTKFPAYVADPMEPKLAETKRMREEAEAKMQGTPWAACPTGCKSGPTDSIMVKNLPLSTGI